jgi:PAS domain-containing protein
LNDALEKHQVPWPLPPRRELRQMLAAATLEDDTLRAEQPQQDELPLDRPHSGVRHLFLLMSKEGLFLAVSDSLLHATGYTRAELIGMPVSVILRPREDLAQTEPDNFDAFMELMRGERDILENVRSHGIAKNGRPVTCCSTVYWCPSKEAWLIDAVEIPTSLSPPAPATPELDEWVVFDERAIEEQLTNSFESWKSGAPERQKLEREEQFRRWYSEHLPPYRFGGNRET